MPHNSKRCVRLGFFAFALCVSVANAVEVTVTNNRNWIWFGTSDSDKPPNAQNGAQTETNGKVTLSGTTGYKDQYYTPPTNFIDSIIVDGSSSLASLGTNQTFSIGTLTMKGESALNMAGAWTPNVCDNNCGLFNVTNLVLDTTKDKTQYVKFVDAKHTTIIGEGTINFNKGTQSLPNNANLGDVVVKGKDITIKSSADTTATANSVTIESGAKLTFSDEVQGNIDIGTLNVKSGAEVAKNNGTNGKLTISSVVAEAGAKGLDSILSTNTTLTLTAIKGGSIADFLSDSSTSTNLGTTLPSGYKEGATIKHNVADSGVFKYSGDFVQVVAKGNDGNYNANTQTTNLNVAPSDRLQATLDNKYLAHHILLSNAMAINNKLFLFDSFKSNGELQKEAKIRQFKNANKNIESPENEVENRIDSWADYEYNNISEYGKALNADSHSVQLGVGYLRTNLIKVGGFFRYTYLGADNADIGNSYSAHAYNAGFYAVANVWSNGYFRGQVSYTGINAKGNYALRNDMTDTNTSGALKDNFHYLTTSVGVAQEGIMGSIFWGSVALDITHIVSLIEESEFADYSFAKNSITLATISGMFGVKIFDSMIYAMGQVGYVMSSKDSEIDLSQRAMNDFYGANGAGANPNSQWQGSFGIISDYKYNMIVGDIGIGAAYNFTRAFKGSAYLGAGFYSESKPNFRIGMGLNYLF